MQATRRRDTAPEVAVRQLLHARGLRFRVDRRILPELRQRVDIVFVAAQVAAFIDGCFWHSCPMHRTSPRTNRAWWTAKLAENCRRDEETNRRLRTAGWLVVRVWEHEAPATAAARIARAVRGRLRRRLS
jgi:DNA mismatch endonuclease, patch repair protein